MDQTESPNPAPSDSESGSQVENRASGVEFGGDTTIGGDVVGRDKIVHDSHDQYQVGGDIITVGPDAKNVAIGKAVSQHVIESGAGVERDESIKDRGVPSEKPQGLLSRILGRGRERGHGDRVAVGEGAQNIAIGRFILQNNIRIGTLVIPARLILALVAVGIALAVGAWLAFVPAQMPPNTFNVAIAQFGQVDSLGRVVGSPDGAELSKWMYGELDRESANLLTDKTVIVWQDSMGPLLKRSTIGLIEDEEAAAALASSIRAHMVIYGNLAANQTPATFTPQFYVAELTGEGDELLGSQQLGAPIPVQAPIDFSDQVTGEYFDHHLKPRTEILIWFTRGLVHDLSGHHASALQVFREAEATLQDWGNTACEPGRPNASQGKEVLYYFIGREALFLARDEAEAGQAFASVDQALDVAQDAFRTALTIRCDYARAHFGLGNVFMQRAQRVLGLRLFDPDDLQRARQNSDAAIEQHNAALRAAAQSPGSGVDVKARIALGMAYFVKGQTYSAGGDYAAAVPLFQSAMVEIQTGLRLLGADDHRLLAQTYQSLAGVNFVYGHSAGALGDRESGRTSFKLAIGYYDQCIAEADAQLYDAFLQQLKADFCIPQRADVEDALAELDTAP